MQQSHWFQSRTNCKNKLSIFYIYLVVPFGFSQSSPAQRGNLCMCIHAFEICPCDVNQWFNYYVVFAEAGWKKTLIIECSLCVTKIALINYHVYITMYAFRHCYRSTLINTFRLYYITLCYVMLCYVMLCYVMLCYVMLCYVLFCFVLLCYVTMFSKIGCICLHVIPNILFIRFSSSSMASHHAYT